MWMSQPWASGRSTTAPPGESSTASSLPGEASVIADEAVARAAHSSSAAPAASSVRSSTSRSRTWMGTPPVPPSAEQVSRFSAQATPEWLRPSFASTPASVAVVNQAPSP